MLQYAGDAALPSHSPSDFQENLNTLADAYHRADLIINTKKTEILSSIQHSFPSSQLSFTVHSDALNTTQQFIYIGSILSSDSDLINEIQQRVKLASSAFGRLANRVFFNCNLTVSTKVAVYKAICLSILLYKAGFHIDDTSRRWKPIMSAAYRLQSILGIRWWHRKTHTEIRETAKIESVEFLLSLLQRQLRWLGHVIRRPMPSNRLPRRLLYGELQLGQNQLADQSCVTLTTALSVLRKCNIPESQLEALAEDRVLWSLT